MTAVTTLGEDALATSKTAELCPDSESQTLTSHGSVIRLPGHRSVTHQESSVENLSKTNVIHMNFMVSPAAQPESPSTQKISQPGVEKPESASTTTTVPLQSLASSVQVSKESVISKLLQSPVTFTNPSNSAPKKNLPVATSTNAQSRSQVRLTTLSLSENVPTVTAEKTSIPSFTADANLTGTTVYIIEEVGSTSAEGQSTPMDTSHPKDLLKCEECDYSTHNKHYLKQHVDLVHCDERPYRCPFCDYAGKRSHSLKEHLVVHSNDRPFQCSKCNATFRKKGHLTNHIKMHSPPATPQLVDCPVCGERVEERTRLYKHLRNCHSSENVYVCDVCDFATTSNTNIALHLHSHKNKERLRCKHCDFISNDETILARHLESHVVPKSPVVLMKCTECGFTTRDNDILKEHMWQHINKPEVRSPPQLVLATNDMSPQELVTGDTAYRCGECSHETKEAYKFIAHMLTHKSVSVSRVTRPSQNPQEVPAVQGQMAPIPTALSEESKSPPIVGDNSGFTHDQTIGRFCCNICQYTCDYQRTIKAHVWKHSGHKDIDYPMFQNGPLSIYDDTSIVSDDGSKTANPAPDITANQDSAPGPVDETCSERDCKDPTPRAITPSLVKLLSSKAFGEVKCIKTAELHNSNKNSSVNQRTGAKSSIEVLKPDANSEGVEISSIPVPVSMYVQTLMSQNHMKRILTETVLVDRPSTAGNGMANPVTSLSPNANPVTSICPTANPVTSICPSANPVTSICPSANPVTSICPSGSSHSPSFTVVHSEIGRGLSKVVSLPKPVLVGGDSGFEVDMIRAAKRLCTEERKLGQNVVVEIIQNVPSMSTFTGLRSQQGSPRAPEMMSGSEVNLANLTTGHMSSDEGKLISATSNPLLVVPVSDGQKMSPDIKDKMWSEEEIAKLIASGATIKKIGCDLFGRTVQMKENSNTLTSLTSADQDSTGILLDPSSVHEEQALTLLSLLKKGPGQGPGQSVLKDSDMYLDVAQQEIHFSDTVIGLQEEQVMSVDEGSQTTEENSKENFIEEEEEDSESKPKAGICSSLLAVIEQLRERSKSESETDDGLQQAPTGGKRKGRRRNRKNSSEEGTPIESMTNVETLDDCEIKYRCKLCHYTNSSIILMKQHMRLHKTKKPFECSLCDFVAESSETLQDHMIQHCKVRTYQCKICPSAFNYKSQLRAHMRAHNEKDPFLCDSCDFETTNPITFRNHTRMHSEGKIYPFKCEHCGELCTSKFDLKTHQEVCKMQVFACEECNFETSTKEELKEHEKTHAKKQLCCGQCDYLTFSTSSMRVHARVHEEVKEMKCELCSFIAASSRSLKSHMKRHINDQRYVQQPLEQYKCNLCGYVCHHLPSLKSHMWRHASDKNYIYEFTNEVINAAIDFDSRPEDEGGASLQIKTPPPCDDVTVEIKMEEGEDRGQEPCLVTFRCCQCGFETISKSNLNKHMKMHADIIEKTLDVTRTVAQHKGRPVQVE